MVKLTDLPNELLLLIIDNVSPLYIDSFVLSCKRIYNLSTDTIRAQSLIRSRLPNDLSTSQPPNLLRFVWQYPDLALYPLSWSVIACVRGEFSVTKVLLAKIGVLVPQNPHTALPLADGYNGNDEDMIIPYLINCLVNLRKIRLFVFWQPSLIDTVAHIVRDSHGNVPSLRENLALGRLTEASIHALGQSIQALHLAVLLSMIPTVKKLKVFHLANKEPYSFPYDHYRSEVTDICLDGCVDLSFLKELIKHTHNLQSFRFTYRTMYLSRDIACRRLSEILEQHAGSSLLHLSLLTGDCATCGHEACLHLPRNYSDLSLGSLQGFNILKTFTTCVDMCVRTYHFSSHQIGSGQVETLLSWLPTSLEALVLHKGVEAWHQRVLRSLFQWFRYKKHAFVSNLKLIHFVDFPDYDQVMPRGIKVVLREKGIKIGYTSKACQDLDCRQVFQRLERWEELPWIEDLGECYCRPHSSDHGVSE